MRKIDTKDLERAARVCNSRVGLKREATANPVYSEEYDNGEVRVEYWKRSDIGEKNWNYSVVDYTADKEWKGSGSTLAETRKIALRKIIMVEFSGRCFWYQTIIMEPQPTRRTESVELATPVETSEDSCDSQNTTNEKASMMSKIETKTVKAEFGLRRLFSAAAKTIAALFIMTMVSCTSQKEEVKINRNSSNLTQKASAVSIVEAMYFSRICTIMVYRPHKVFPVLRNDLKPLPISRHNLPGVMILLNGVGHERI